MTQATDAAILDPSSVSAGGHSSARRRKPALGSDPFAQGEDGPDPFLEHLALLQRTDGIPTFQTARNESPQHSAITARERTRLKEREWIEVPELSEIELPDRTSWVDRLLSDEERRRIASITTLAGGDAAYDRFGLSVDVVRNTLPIMMALYRIYFRVRSHGHEHIRKRGPVIIAGNHAGVLPFDAAMVVTDLLLESDPPRLARMVVDRWAGTLPWVNVLYARIGQVVGTDENFADLLASGQTVAVFPEGMRGAIKPFSERYRVQEFRVGFIEQSLASGAPIIPTAVVGSDDQMPVLLDLSTLAKRLGLPSFPITPTFPWLGPLGLLPYPVSYEIVYGEPLSFYESYGPEDARDPELLRSLSRQVRRAVQRLIDLHR
ncbi:MAG: lysophospholipid acyltransferase family protein [Myxococcota bacterium]